MWEINSPLRTRWSLPHASRINSPLRAKAPLAAENSGTYSLKSPLATKRVFDGLPMPDSGHGAGLSLNARGCRA